MSHQGTSMGIPLKEVEALEKAYSVVKGGGGDGEGEWDVRT